MGVQAARKANLGAPGGVTSSSVLRDKQKLGRRGASEQCSRQGEKPVQRHGGERINWRQQKQLS